MARQTAAHGALARLRRVAGGGALFAAALVVAAFSGAAPADAAWRDTATLEVDGSITAGSPGLSVSGFENLDFEYELLALSTSATVTVTNTGDVPLHDFTVAPALLEGGSSALQNAVSVSFVPIGGGPGTGWDAWLSGITLAPGASAQYVATSTLPLWDALLIGSVATTVVTVEATAGASLLLVADNGFTQTVLVDVPPSVDDFNMFFTAYSSHNIDVFWVNPPGASGTTSYHLWVEDYMLGDQSSFYWPHHSLASGQIPTSLWPATGVTHAVTLTVTVDGTGEQIARGTIWLTGVTGGEPTIAVIAPAQASAALVAPATAPLAAAAPTTPVTPAPAPAASVPAALAAPEAPSGAPAAEEAPEEQPAPTATVTPAPAPVPAPATASTDPAPAVTPPPPLPTAGPAPAGAATEVPATELATEPAPEASVTRAPPAEESEVR